MNKQFEKEIKSILSNVIIEEAKGDVEYIARKFYKLAIENVKNEIARIRSNVYVCAELRPTERQLGACMALDDVDNFINKLLK